MLLKTPSTATLLAAGLTVNMGPGSVMCCERLRLNMRPPSVSSMMAAVRPPCTIRGCPQMLRPREMTALKLQIAVVGGGGREGERLEGGWWLRVVGGGGWLVVEGQGEWLLGATRGSICHRWHAATQALPPASQQRTPATATEQPATHVCFLSL